MEDEEHTSGNDLRRALRRIEHRAEVLMAIAEDLGASGRPEAALAYRNQAAQARRRLDSVRRILERIT